MSDPNLYKRDELCAVGLDLWQVKSGTIFDNIFLGDDIAEAAERGEALKKRLEGEKKMKSEQDEIEREKEKAEKPDDEDLDDEDLDDEAGDAAPVVSCLTFHLINIISLLFIAWFYNVSKSLRWIIATVGFCCQVN